MEEEPKRISLPIYFVPKCLFMLVVLAAIFLFSSCQPQAVFDICGRWDYSMMDTYENTYDKGSIRFDGKPRNGTYLQINIYDMEYKGEYKVRGNNKTLTGDESWDVVFINENYFSGTWQHDAEANGNFEAIRIQ